MTVSFWKTKLPFWGMMLNFKSECSEMYDFQNLFFVMWEKLTYLKLNDLELFYSEHLNLFCTSGSGSCDIIVWVSQSDLKLSQIILLWIFPPLTNFNHLDFTYIKERHASIQYGIRKILNRFKLNCGLLVGDLH